MKRLILAAAIFIAACSNSENATVQEIDIKDVQMPNLEPLDLNPLYMSYNQGDNSMFVNNGSMAEYCIQKISLESGEITNMIRKGRGRDEYIQLRITDIDNDGNIFGRSRPFELKFSSNCKLISKYDTSDLNLNILSSSRFKNHNVAYGNFNYPKSLLTLFDDSWQEVCHFGEFPDDVISEATCGEFGKIMAYQGVILGSDSRSRVAFVSYQGEFFNIYSIDKENNVALIHSKQDNLPKYKSQNDIGVGVAFSTKRNYYISMCNTDDRIYILYSGKELQAPNNIAYMNARLSNKIMVFDWDGNHLYNLNSELDMLNICVSSDDKELYAVYFDDEAEYRLCRFDISEI